MTIFTLFILLAIFSVSWCSFEPLQVMCEVNGKMIPAIVDTGAEISVMSTSCARRCDLWQSIDTQHSGRAIGVGSSDIIGGIEGLGIRIGPLSFQNKISILRNSNHRCDFIIGLDILKRFNCDIIMRERVIKMYVRGNEVRIPLVTKGEGKHSPTDLSGHFQSTISKQQQQQQQSSPTNPPIFSSQPTTSTGKPPLSPPVFLDEDEDEEFENAVEYDEYLSQRHQTSLPSDETPPPTTRRMEYVVNRHCYDDASSQSASRRRNMWPGNRVFHSGVATHPSPTSTRKEYSDPDLEKYVSRQQQRAPQRYASVSSANRYVSHQRPFSSSGGVAPHDPRTHHPTPLYTTDAYDEHEYEEAVAYDTDDDVCDTDDEDCHDDTDLGDNEDFEDFHERHRDRSVSMEGV